MLNVALLHKIVNSIATYFSKFYQERVMSKRSWLMVLGITAWVVAASYFGEKMRF